MRMILITNLRRGQRLLLIAAGLMASVLFVSLLSACGSNNQSSAADPGSRIKVVAAENFWGSIASQVGGSHVQAVSIITNPDTDPHDYDATPADARTMAQAQLAIVNGIGYDPWATKLLAANSSSNRVVVNVGDVVGLKEGDNPHRWYSPTDVAKVTAAITDALKKLDSADSSAFDMQQTDFQTNTLKTYNDLRSEIKQKYSGVAVGATESIFTPLAQDLGLHLITPESFLDAVSEGSDPTAADKTTIDQQIAQKQIKVLVFNSQNATPDVQALVDKAHSENIPVVSVTETLSPASATFQDWQSQQLQALVTALAQATGQ